MTGRIELLFVEVEKIMRSFEGGCTGWGGVLRIRNLVSDIRSRLPLDKMFAKGHLSVFCFFFVKVLDHYDQCSP